MSPLELADTAEQWTIEAMEIRADFEDVLELNAACFQRSWTREMLVKELARPELAYIFVVRSAQQRVVGYCATWIILDELHINSIAVRSDWRGRGVARALVAYVLDWSRLKNVSRATLEVRRSNESARALYKRLGFELSGVRPNYYSNPCEDALILFREKVEPQLETTVCV